jgi:uncharacterized protein GlcG (DUF336 family)
MITLNDARNVIAAAEKKAIEIRQPMNIAVADAGGNLVRQDCPYGSQPDHAFLIVRFAGTPLLRARRLICSYLL